jgi:hypothetical protein
MKKLKTYWLAFILVLITPFMFIGLICDTIVQFGTSIVLMDEEEDKKKETL